MALDELGFASVYMAPPAALALRWHAQQMPGLPAHAAGCGLVVDAGFSFTHAVSGVCTCGMRRSHCCFRLPSGPLPLWP